MTSLGKAGNNGGDPREFDPLPASQVAIKKGRQSWGELKHVAAVRVGALGDSVVGLSAFRELKHFFPKAKFTVVGPRSWTEIIEPDTWPEIERIAVVAKKSQTAKVYVRNGNTWVEPAASTPLLELFKTCDGICNFNIDSYRYAFTALRAGVRVRIGSTTAHMAWLYTHASPWLGKNPEIHERDAALFLLEYSTDSIKRVFRSTEKNRTHLAGLLAKSKLAGKWRVIGLPRAKKPDFTRAAQVAGREHGTYLLVNPTSTRRTNTWPSDRFNELLRSCAPEFKALGLEPLIFGAPNETDWLNEVAKSDFRIVQPNGLMDMQDVLAGAAALLTNTSSLQFVAATTKTPVFTIMGRGIPEIWGPLCKQDQVIRGRPPEHLNDRIFEQEQAAYESLTVEEVKLEFLKWLTQLLKKS